jgi:hypothetical protein
MKQITTLKPILRFLLINFVLISSILFPEIIEGQLLTFDLKKLPEKSTVKLSQIGAADIQYIPLETNPQSVIPRISKIIFSRSYFLTQSYSDINMFRYDGSFVTKIGTIGKGPNEFTTAHDVDINPKDESIYVADGWLKKFLVYNKNGKVVRTFKCPVSASMIFKFTDDGILCYFLNNMGNIENSFMLIDTTGKIIKNFSNKYPWKRTGPTVAFPAENFFYRNNGILIKNEMYSDTVYTYKNKSFEPYFIIDFGKLRLTAAKREEYDAKYIMNNFLSPVSLFEFGNCIYYEFIIPYKGKMEGLSYIGSKNGNLKLLFDPEKDLINDIDGGPNFWPRTAKDNSTVIAWIDAIKLKQYVASVEFKSSKPKYPEKKKELEKLANSLKETDNPVLMMIRVKM